MKEYDSDIPQTFDQLVRKPSAPGVTTVIINCCYTHLFITTNITAYGTQRFVYNLAFFY